jgi:hypothetical protein
LAISRSIQYSSESAGEAVVASLGDLGRHVVEYAFGDVYTRPGVANEPRVAGWAAGDRDLDAIRGHPDWPA